MVKLKVFEREGVFIQLKTPHRITLTPVAFLKNAPLDNPNPLDFLRTLEEGAVGDLAVSYFVSDKP